MAYLATDVLAGAIDLYQVDTLGPGALAGLANGPTSRGFTNYPGLEIRAYDYNLGGGVFVYGRAAGTLIAGQSVELGVNVTTARYDINMVAWVGGVNSGKSLAFAMAPLTAGQFGWFQVEGLVVAAVSGAPAVGNPVYWQAAGVVSPTLVASKQAVGATFASAVSAVVGTGAPSLVAYAPGATAYTLSATQALVLVNRPSAQPQIT
jgi:hypothetical protein